MLNARVQILYNEPTLPPDHPDADSEHDILYTADTVARILQSAGFQVSRLGVTDDAHALLTGLASDSADVIFNLYEGLAKWGNTEAFVSGILELLRLPFTGCPTQALQLCRSKPLTKMLLTGAGIPTAGFFVVENDPIPLCPLPWPVIVKPGAEDASIGIDQNSVVTSQKQLVDRIEYLRATYGPLVLVEQFIRGREFNVSLFEKPDGLITLPFSEILFIPPDDAPDLWPIVSYDAKWRPGTTDFTATPAKNPAENVSAELHERVCEIVRKAYRLMGCRDYARVDVRVSETGIPYVLEVNPNPCISPLAGLAAGLESAQIPYQDFICGLVHSALLRSGKSRLSTSMVPERNSQVSHSHPPDDSNSIHELEPIEVRPATFEDRGAIVSLIGSADHWHSEERLAMIRDLEQPTKHPNRQVFVQTSNSAIVGSLSLTHMDFVNATYRLDWIILQIDYEFHLHASRLLEFAESSILNASARMLIADLPSSASFGTYRQLLLKSGFRPAGELPDYYRDGYSRLTFAKILNSTAATLPSDTISSNQSSH